MAQDYFWHCIVLVIAGMLLVMSLLMFLYNTDYQNQEYYGQCTELKLVYKLLDTQDCIDYINEYPNTTKKKLLEHFNVVINNDWLNQPIVEKEAVLEPSILTTQDCLDIGNKSVLLVQQCMSWLESNPGSNTDEMMRFLKIK